MLATSLFLLVAKAVLVLLVGGGFIGWLMWRALKNSPDGPMLLVVKWVASVVVVGLIIGFVRGIGRDSPEAGIVPIAGAICGILLAVIWLKNLVLLAARPFEALFTGGSAPPEPEPLYSIAEARRKQGRFLEAVDEIQRQLAQFPNDVYGQILLAEIQAENLDDLPGAQLGIERLCQQPGHAPKSISYALNRLADWHLKYRRDTDAARQALARIVELFPENELAQIASHRIAHLGRTEELIASQDRTPIHLEAGVQNVGLLKSSRGLRAPVEDPAAKAADYVKQLEQHPFDSEVREKLALIYASHYQRLDLAMDQLEQLIQQPNQPSKQVVHSLNLLADLQIEHALDYEAARQTLQRIVDLYPELAAAEIARQRLAHLKLEIKGKEQTQVIKLGTYEQNIGLKKR